MQNEKLEALKQKFPTGQTFQVVKSDIHYYSDGELVVVEKVGSAKFDSGKEEYWILCHGVQSRLIQWLTEEELKPVDKPE